jgi:hypothetical protein
MRQVNFILSYLYRFLKQKTPFEKRRSFLRTEERTALCLLCKTRREMSGRKPNPIGKRRKPLCAIPKVQNDTGAVHCNE